MQDVRKHLDTCDECPNTHYSNVISIPGDDPESALEWFTSLERMGHSVICYLGSECHSKLRILRAASSHHSVLRSFLRSVYNALSSHKCIAQFDECLNSGDFKTLMKVIQVDFETLFSNKV